MGVAGRDRGETKEGIMKGIESKVAIEVPRPVTFAQCVLECARNRELVEQFDRLTGSNLSRRGTAFQLLIDDASGRFEADARRFLDFVREFIWAPLQEQ